MEQMLQESNQSDSKKLFNAGIKRIFLMTLALCGMSTFLMIFTTEDSEAYALITIMIFAVYYALLENFKTSEAEARAIILETILLILFVVFASYFPLKLGIIEAPEDAKDTLDPFFILVEFFLVMLSFTTTCLALAAYLKMLGMRMQQESAK